MNNDTLEKLRDDIRNSGLNTYLTDRWADRLEVIMAKPDYYGTDTGMYVPSASRDKYKLHDTHTIPLVRVK